MRSLTAMAAKTASYISRLGIIIKINAITDIPGGIGSSKASHVLIFSKKPLRLFSVCNRKLSSLEEKQLLISPQGAHRETVLEGCANSFNIINNFSFVIWQELRACSELPFRPKR